MRYWDGTKWTEHVSTVAAARVRDHASFGRRLLAFFVDVLILIVANRILQWPLHWVFGTPIWPQILLGVYAGALWFGYQWIFITRNDATPGMRVLHISVRFLQTDPRTAAVWRASIFAVAFGVPIAIIGFGLVAELAAGIVSLAFIIGCLMMLTNPLGQTWHDRLSSTQVVDDRAIDDDSGSAAASRGEPLPTRTRNLIYGVAALGLAFYVIGMVIGTIDAASRYPMFGHNPFG